jgi:hypothetical protein
MTEIPPLEIGRYASTGVWRMVCIGAWMSPSATGSPGAYIQKHIRHPLIRLGPVKQKGGLKVRRLVAATSDNYRAELLGLV